MPEPGRWADTEEARRIIASIRDSLERWKASGHDVSDLERYLASPDPTPTGIDARLRLLLNRIKEPWPGDVQYADPSKCPHCGQKTNPAWQNCRFCGSNLSAAKFPSGGDGPGGWAGTEEGRRRVNAVREMIRGWKLEGFDVSELEAYIDFPDITPEGVDHWIRVVTKRIIAQMRDGASRSDPPECPRCYADLSPKDRNCPSCGIRILRPGEAPDPERCPECRSRVGPKDRKCPICGHRLRPWSLFS